MFCSTPACSEWCLLTSGAFGSSENFLSLERSSAVYSFALSVRKKRVLLAALDQNSDDRKNKQQVNEVRELSSQCSWP